MNCRHQARGSGCTIGNLSKAERIDDHGYCPFHAVENNPALLTPDALAVMNAVLFRICSIESDEVAVFRSFTFHSGVAFPADIRRPIRFEGFYSFKDDGVLASISTARAMEFNGESASVVLSGLTTSDPISFSTNSDSTLSFANCHLSQVTVRSERGQSAVNGVTSVLKSDLRLTGHRFRVRLAGSDIEGGMTFAGRCLQFVISDHEGRRSKVGKDLTLEGVDIQSAIEISNTDLSASIKAANAEFRELLKLTACNVGGSLKLRGAGFKKGLVFDDVVIQGTFDLSAEDTDAPDHRPLRTLLFGRTVFHKTATFARRTFTGRADFLSCTFHKAPYFFGCTLHQNVRFPSGDNFKDTSTEAIGAYRQLKQEMERLRARAEEGTFFALEQRSKRASPSSLGTLEKIVSVLYAVFTDYGQNFLRPLLWLTGLLIISTLVFSHFQSPFCFSPCTANRAALLSGFSQSIEFAVNPFSVWRKEGITSIAAEDLDHFKLLATLHSLLALVFIALFLLALRWRFKRD